MKDFRKYGLGVGLQGSHIDAYERMQTKMSYRVSSPMGMTPYIMEERSLNIIQMDVFSRLMMDRIIFMGDTIYDDTANVIVAQMLFMSTNSDEDINIYINSPGGSVYAGLAIYDVMQYIKNDVRTICTGMAASMGAVLLSSGAKGKRQSLKHSKIMIHQPLAATGGQLTDMEIDIANYKKDAQVLYGILSENTGKSVDVVEKDCDRDNWMSSTEAKDYGLIDDVI